MARSCLRLAKLLGRMTVESTNKKGMMGDGEEGKWIAYRSRDKEG